MPVGEVKVVTCPRCGHTLGLDRAGAGGVNYCRALLLFQVIQQHPGLTGWELAQLVDVPYSVAMRGTEKLRMLSAVQFVAEERTQGGIRFRYFPHAQEDVVQESLYRLTYGHDVAAGRVGQTPW